MPSPHSSTPQLFDTTSNPVTLVLWSAAISVEGMPQSPKPPTASVAPSVMPDSATSALTTLSIEVSPCTSHNTSALTVRTGWAGRCVYQLLLVGARGRVGRAETY